MLQRALPVSKCPADSTGWQTLTSGLTVHTVGAMSGVQGMSAAAPLDTVLHCTALIPPSVAPRQAHCSVAHHQIQGCHTGARLTTSISELCCSLSVISASSRAILAVRMAKLFIRSLRARHCFSVQKSQVAQCLSVQ